MDRSRSVSPAGSDRSRSVSPAGSDRSRSVSPEADPRNYQGYQGSDIYQSYEGSMGEMWDNPRAASYRSWDNPTTSGGWQAHNETGPSRGMNSPENEEIGQGSQSDIRGQSDSLSEIKGKGQRRSSWMDNPALEDIKRQVEQENLKKDFMAFNNKMRENMNKMEKDEFQRKKDLESQEHRRKKRLQ